MASGLGRGHSCNLRAGVMVVNRALLNVLSLLIIAGVSLPQSVPPTGLYFMLNGIIYPPGDSVLISDIGDQPFDRIYPGSTLVCVTANVNAACCRSLDNNGLTTITAGSVGEWYYPDGSLVPRPGGNVSDFARISYTHQVRLARVLSPTPPLGVYTCKVPEPNGILHKASIMIHEDITTTTPPVIQTTFTSPDITTTTHPVTQTTPTTPPPAVVSLTAPGQALVGSEVTLNCSSDVMGSFVWSHSSISDLSLAASVAISQDASGVFSVLTISSVLISHAGTYSCEVSAAGQSSTKSTHLRVQLCSPTLVDVTSPLNLLGYPLTLTCSVGLVAMLEPGVQIQVQWTDSSGGAANGGTLAMHLGTFYTSQLTLANTEESNVGVNYTCTASLVSTLAFIDSSDTVSNSAPILPQTVFFQVQVEEISQSMTMKFPYSRQKTDEVVNEIVSTVSSSCGCGFTSGHLTDSVFLCSSFSPNSVTYQAQLHGTPQANVSQLIKIIAEELYKERMSIKVQFSLLFFENVCIVPYGTGRPCDDVSSTSNVGILTGVTVTFVAVVIVMGSILVALTWKLIQTKRKLTEQSHISDNLKMVHNDIETKDCEAYGVAPSALTSSSRLDYEHVLF